MSSKFPQLIDRMKEAGLIQTPEQEHIAREALTYELRRRKTAGFYLELENPAASFAFFREFVVPKRWRDGLAQIHIDGAQFIVDPRFDQKVILWPRETLKTSQFTVGENTRIALADADNRIFLGHHKHKKAMKFLSGIRGLLQKKSVVEMFGLTLPEKNDKYRPDNQEELTLSTRKDLTIREATFTTGGVDKTDTSGHFTHMSIDDLITENNSEDAEQLEKPIAYWRSLLDLLDKAVGKMWIIGTRYHLLDLSGIILDEFTDPDCRVIDAVGQVRQLNHLAGCHCDFDLMLREMHNDDGTNVYPAHFTEKVIDRLLRQKGPIAFAKQYNNNPIDPLTCWLKPNEIAAMRISKKEIDAMVETNDLILFQVVDPAESKKKHSAFTAIVTIGVHKRTGIWYVMGATKARVETGPFIQLILDEHKKFKPHVFGMELNTRKALKYVVEDRMKQEKYFFEIQELNPRTNDGPDEKKRRFKQNVIPLCQHGRVRVDEGLRDMISFLTEAPNARYWDIGDAMSYVVELAPVIAELPEAEQFKMPEYVEQWPGTGM